jgi:MoaA/NifB/PqqE/SkfB family radical SAM enzyme
MNSEKVRNIFEDAKTLGISFIVIAGGEPLVRRDILDITKDFPEIIFLIFTNGLLVDDSIVKKLNRQKNTIPVFSLEGNEQETDNRRGTGVYRAVRNNMEKMKQKDIFFGVSLTLTGNNFNSITDEHFIQELIEQRCKLFFFPNTARPRKGPKSW